MRGTRVGLIFVQVFRFPHSERTSNIVTDRWHDCNLEAYLGIRRANRERALGAGFLRALSGFGMGGLPLSQESGFRVQMACERRE